MNNNLSNQSGNEITLVLGISFIKKRLSIILISTLTIFTISLIYAIVQPNIYRSSGIYEIANSGETSSPIETQGLSSIAGAVGVSLGKPSSNKADLIIETVKSKGFLKHLINIDGVLPDLYAISSYSPESASISYDPSIFLNNKWVDGQVPSIHEVHKIYEKSLSIRRDNGDGFIYITFQHQSPYFAEYFLSTLVSELNLTMRMKAAAESNNSIQFLTDEFTKTNWLEIRNSISSLLQDHFQTKMLANVREEYALKPIESPFVEEEKYSPSRLSIVLWWSVAGFLLITMIVFALEAYAHQSKIRSSE
tara:strand:+ start:17166 stop:18086 length:921 start_codon:yes stop_codon:yes gene_type:complete